MNNSRLANLRVEFKSSSKSSLFSRRGILSYFTVESVS